jgi:hypothetical protein
LSRWNRDVPAVFVFGEALSLRSYAEPDFAGFQQADEDTHNEVDVLRSRVTGRGRKVQAAAAEETVQCAFVAHN